MEALYARHGQSVHKEARSLSMYTVWKQKGWMQGLYVIDEVYIKELSKCACVVNALPLRVATGCHCCATTCASALLMLYVYSSSVRASRMGCVSQVRQQAMLDVSAQWCFCRSADYNGLCTKLRSRSWCRRPTASLSWKLATNTCKMTPL